MSAGEQRALWLHHNAPEVHARQVRAHLVGFTPPVVRVAQAQLAAVVPPPALDVPVVEQRARVLTAERERHRRAPRPELNRGHAAPACPRGWATAHPPGDGLSPISPTTPPRSLVLPRPSWPYGLTPQHLSARAVPFSSLEHVWPPPTATSTAVHPTPRSTLGRFAPISLASPPRSFVSPRPSWPSPLCPSICCARGARGPGGKHG